MISLRVFKVRGTPNFTERDSKGRHVRKGTHIHNLIEGAYICQHIYKSYIEIGVYN